MRKRTIFIAVVATAVVAVPAVVIAGVGNSLSGDVDRQVSNYTGKHTAPKDWQTVPDAGVLPTPDSTLLSTTVSADMAKGKVRFRVRTESGTNIAPGPALFAAPGSNSFMWATSDPCDIGEFPTLQWKRAGKAKAVASRISVLNLFESNACV